MTQWHKTNFKLLERELNGESKSALHSLRKQALVEFEREGFPTTKHEEWIYTDVSSIANGSFVPSPTIKGQLPQLPLSTPLISGEVLHAHRLVFINGNFVDGLSDLGNVPAGVKIMPLSKALKTETDAVLAHLGKYVKEDGNPFTLLNAAFIREGVFILIPDGTALEHPICLEYISTQCDAAFAAHPRNLIVVGARAEVAIVEMYRGAADNIYFNNPVTEIVAGEAALIEHDKYQDESQKAYHISAMFVEMKKGSSFVSNSISVGGAIVRNNIWASLNEERVECTLNGLSLATGTQLVDNHTTIDHAKPNCQSHELYKSILDGKSKGIFNGKIFVRKDAQKTDAKQTNKTLLLSDDATIDTKPQLEIFADDVKCTHGATVGQLDDEQIFYLRSRGIGLEESRDMLTFAFASDVINRIHAKELREQLDFLLHRQLQRGRVSYSK
jgi:Fe-S cluster assembly protein SufD